jgi:hypothetical protein
VANSCCLPIIATSGCCWCTLISFRVTCRWSGTVRYGIRVGAYRRVNSAPSTNPLQNVRRASPHQEINFRRSRGPCSSASPVQAGTSQAASRSCGKGRCARHGDGRSWGMHLVSHCC